MTREQIIDAIALFCTEYCDDTSCLVCAEKRFKEYEAKIREEAVDELADLIDRLLWNYDETAYRDLAEAFKAVARSVKEQNHD